MQDREARIREGLATYQGRRTKKTGRPYVWDFRGHVGIRDVSTAEIKAAMQAIADGPARGEPAAGASVDWVPPRITNQRVERQMRGAGFKFKDGYPVQMPSGGTGKTFGTGECTYKYADGNLFLIWEQTTWNEQRDVMYEAIIDQSLVLDGKRPAKSMFRFHHAWLNYSASYRQTKLERVQGVVPGVAAKRVAWMDGGEVLYTTTIGALLAQSLSCLQEY